MPEVPTWLRIVDIIFGIIVIVLAVAVILIPSFFILYGISVVLGIVLITLGIARLLKSFFSKEIITSDRALNLIISLIMLIFGALFIVSPTFFPMLLVFIMAGAILVIGIFILVQGLMSKELKSWTRILLIIFAFIAIGIAIPAFIFWATWGMDLVNIVIATGLMIFGVLRLIMGLTGDYY